MVWWSTGSWHCVCGESLTLERWPVRWTTIWTLLDMCLSRMSLDRGWWWRLSADGRWLVLLQRRRSLQSYLHWLGVLCQARKWKYTELINHILWSIIIRSNRYKKAFTISPPFDHLKTFSKANLSRPMQINQNMNPIGWKFHSHVRPPHKSARHRQTAQTSVSAIAAKIKK